MEIFDWFLERLMENGWILPTICVSFFLLAAVAVIGFFCRDRGFFMAFAVMVAGGAAMLLMASGMDILTLFFVGILLAFLTAFVYVLLTCALIVRAVVLRRKKRRAEILRKVQYTLPDKENSYIRSRLNNALQGENLQSKSKALNALEHVVQERKEEGVKGAFHADYAKKLLEKLQEAPLTKAERMEMQEISRLFSAYIKKSRWTVEDVRVLNDMFSYLLKISAKYAI